MNFPSMLFTIVIPLIALYYALAYYRLRDKYKFTMIDLSKALLKNKKNSDSINFLQHINKKP